MKACLTLLVITSGTLARAELPYKLPPKAKYNVPAKAIADARTDLSTKLVSNTATLSNLFSKPTLCGPGLWNILKSSPHFSKRPKAKGTARIPLPNGRVQELPMGLLQSEEEVASFRAALAEFLGTQGTLTVREPNQEEFKIYWSVIPFDEISGPLLVAEGRDATLFCQFEQGKVFWVVEVRRMHLKK